MSFSIKESLASNSVNTVLASHNSGVWIGGAEALGFLKQNKLLNIRRNQGFPERNITTMFEDHASRLWIGVDSGVWVLDHERFLPIRTKNSKSLGIVFGITEDAANNE